MLERPNFDGNHLVNHILINHSKLTVTGVCAGLSVASGFNFLSSEKKYQIFRETLASIATYTKEKLKNDLIELKKRKIVAKYILTDEDKLLGEIRFLFEVIAIYSQPEAFRRYFKRSISQPKVSEITDEMKQVYDKPSAKKFFSFVNVGHFPFMLEQKSILSRQYEDFLLDIKLAATKDAPSCRVSLLLDSLEHRVTLNYDGVCDKWLSDDIRHLDKIGQEIPFDQLINHIFKTLRTSDKDKVIELETIVFTAPSNAARFSKCFSNSEMLAFSALKTDEGDIRKTLKNVTLLHLAAKFGEDILNKITDEKLLNAPTNGGLTPLLIAAEQDQTKIAKTLLINKADPDITLNDVTPLSYATQHENQEMMNMLLKAKAALDNPSDAKIGEKRKKMPTSLTFLSPHKTKKGSHFFFTSPDKAVPEGINLHFIKRKIYIQKAGTMVLVLTSSQAQLKKQGLGKKRKLNRSLLIPT